MKAQDEITTGYWAIQRSASDTRYVDIVDVTEGEEKFVWFFGGSEPEQLSVLLSGSDPVVFLFEIDLDEFLEQKAKDLMRDLDL